jgi:hypothetical protein
MSVENALANLVEGLERACALDEPRHLRQRCEALDDLDACLSDVQRVGTALDQRARAIHSRLESVNFNLYESIRRDIQRGAGAGSLLEWMPDGNDLAKLFYSSGGYDYLDDLLSGVLQFDEPSAEVVKLQSEMVPYQPTPARHIFDFIGQTALTERDLLIDLGSGLGQVTLLAAICSSAQCRGVELEPAYVDCARRSARSLNLNNATFIEGDARLADLSAGTVFYLYTPFTGSVLQDVLNSLRHEAADRAIRISTFGPCTSLVAKEPWLSTVGPLHPDRIAVFHSRH